MKPSLSHLVTRFFNAYLANERGVSENTIAAYGDTLCLLIKHLCKTENKKPEKISLEMLAPDKILDFLDHLERDRNNSPSTRNLRLAAIKTFLHYAARENPEPMLQNERIQAIRAKKTDHKPPPSLSVEQVHAILDAIDTSTLIGLRDKALVQLPATPEPAYRKSPTCASPTCVSRVPQPSPSPGKDKKSAPSRSGKKPSRPSRPTCRQEHAPASNPTTSSSATRQSQSPALESDGESNSTEKTPPKNVPA